ncbi:MAG TPA: preprotein translocase subunit SecA, partial [Candidatus Jorgensenbacteria bacterium]|nr:preprotein translocase subunit SecA [Candidatus Jorgensenbacteria bacterium]
MKLLRKFFVDRGRQQLEQVVAQVNEYESKLEGESPEQLGERSRTLRARIQEGVALEDVLPEAFALVREAAKLTLNQRHYDVQIIGGVVLHEGKIAQMLTGEGKTLASTLSVYLNALTGKGVHIVTVNEYLARRDVVWMGQVYHALGLSVACLVHEGAYQYDPEYKAKEDIEQLDKERDSKGSFHVVDEFLRPVSRKEAYLADVTYGTNHEFGFDYLRDNLAVHLEDRVQRGHYYTIVDEVDNILIDEARTPLIISAPDAQSSEYYKIFARIVPTLQLETDYVADEKRRTVSITDAGIEKIERALKVDNLFDQEHARLVHYMNESLKVQALFRKDKDYVVKNGEVIIVDQFTGRMLQGRRYSEGLHQAIEAKEGVQVQQENRTYAQITIQNYFRLYDKIAGMTGTAQSSAEEFDKVYGLEVASIPPNKPVVREDLPDAIYKTNESKYHAVVAEVKRRHELGQPVLLGTASIEHNEQLSLHLQRGGVPHEILNAKQHEREGEIIAQAGRSGAVTVATNMAGRGVDIVLGGNPPDVEEAERVRKAGGLHVIGTDRHEARRIDDQLRGRSGRQGDPGSSQFFLSLEDDLLRIFGGERISNLMGTLRIPEDMPIESGLVSKAVNQAQQKVEGMNLDMRQH